MFETKNNRVLLPIELARYAYDNDLIKALAIYFYLRFYTDGKINKNSDLICQIRKDFRLTDDRTFNKHFKKLIRLNWIGHCPDSGMYFIRQMAQLRVAHDFEDRWATPVLPQHLKNFQIFLAAVLINKEVYDQEFYWDVVQKRRLKKAPNKWVGAKHSTVSSHSSGRPKYFGLCNKRIAQILGCKQTRACEIKNKAAKLGYLEIHHRYRDILELDKPDFNIRARLDEQFPNSKGRIRIWRKWRGKQKYIKVLLQLHDEIVPKLHFKKMKKLSHVRLPIETLRSIHRLTSKAA